MTPGRQRGPGPKEERAGGGGLPHRIVLVGFMAAGKTTVGRLLAERVGYRFVDLDREVERLAGRPIPRIFRKAGETRFRELEAEATRALDPPPGAEGTVDPAPGGIVIAAGGGWMARPELRDRWPGAVRVWLRVEPRTVLDRVPDVTSRPMLDPDAPLASARSLLEERRAEYRRAEAAVDTDELSPDEVVDRILEALRAGTR